MASSGCTLIHPPRPENTKRARAPRRSCKQDRGAVLSDTSGGVSAGAMVGVAGLALAASFLVVVRIVATS